VRQETALRATGLRKYHGSAASIAVTVAGIVAVLTFHATAGQRIAGGGSG
jgi:hypothetical protein